MSADRELLELAAKAAGIDIVLYQADGTPHICDPTGSVSWRWNPLTDDGDALRLAVKLGIEHKKPSRSRSVSRVVQAWFPADGNPARSASAHVSVAIKGDVLAATRRAITCAAAEIGKAMP
jgi:hypothetical protein